MGPPFWKPFLLPVILRPRFWGRFLAQFWDRERATRSCATVLTARISSICWRQLSFCNASRHGHTHPYNTKGTWRRSCFESVKNVHFPEPQDAIMTSCSLAACRLYNAYVRKLSCVHLGRCVVQRQERTYHPHKSTYDPSRPHLRPSNPHAGSAPTTLTGRPTTLQGHIYDPQTRMPGAHLPPSQLNLRPFKITHTTLKPACQDLTQPNFYTNHLLRKPNFNQLLHKPTFTQTTFYANHLLNQPALNNPCFGP